MTIPRKRGITGVFDTSYLRSESDYITDIQKEIKFNLQSDSYRFLWSNLPEVSDVSLRQLNFSELATFANSTDSGLINVDIVNVTFKAMFFNRIEKAIQLLSYVFEHDDSGQVTTYIDHRVA